MLEPLGGSQLEAGRNRKSYKKLIIFLIVIVVIFPIVLTVGIFALIGGGLYYGTKSTEEFKCAMAEIRKDKNAIEILGEPIADGYLVWPNIEISGSRRDVQFKVPVSGPKSSGSLTVISFRDGFRSNFSMQLESEGKQVQIYRGVFPCPGN
jgi:nitrate reductase NapE component